MNPEDVLALLKERRSVRRFRERPVPRALIARLVEAASWAPSPGNRQAWDFAVVESAALKEQMAACVRAEWSRAIERMDVEAVADEMRRYAGNFDWFARAPALIVVSAKRPEGFLVQMLGDEADDAAGTKTSAAMAAQNLMLAAHAVGLGTCCLTGPLAAQAALKEIVRMGARHTIVCVLAVGFPAETPAVPPRKGAAELTRFVE